MSGVETDARARLKPRDMEGLVRLQFQHIGVHIIHTGCLYDTCRCICNTYRCIDHTFRCKCNTYRWLTVEDVGRGAHRPRAPLSQIGLSVYIFFFLRVSLTLYYTKHDNIYERSPPSSRDPSRGVLRASSGSNSNHKAQTPNPKPQTPNPKLRTPNPRPQTQNSKS